MESLQNTIFLQAKELYQNIKKYSDTVTKRDKGKHTPLTDALIDAKTILIAAALEKAGQNENDINQTFVNADKMIEPILTD